MQNLLLTLIDTLAASVAFKRLQHKLPPVLMKRKCIKSWLFHIFYKFIQIFIEEFSFLFL